jgi:redox-sensitive bicupin YhaK (pirin superfamily)
MSAVKSLEKLNFPWQTQDPFLFCAFHQDQFPKGNGQLGPAASLAGRQIGSDFSGKDGWSMYHGQSVPGFPSHPHKGFETITIAERGLVDHSDSLGAAGRFGEGDVQWMTAGGGVQHSEMFPLLKDEEENPLLLFQIWLNLPRASKNVPPHFAMLWHEDIPLVTETDEQGKTSTIKVISGLYKDVNYPAPAPDSFAATAENEIAVWLIEMEPSATLSLPTASGEANRSIYCYQGNSTFIEDRELSNGYMAKLNADEETVLKNGDTKASFLLLQGKPIGEPVVQHGPFVMNTADEIRQTMMDYQQTQFGGWPWPSYAHTHDPSKGRFALHADGTLEEK